MSYDFSGYEGEFGDMGEEIGDEIGDEIAAEIGAARRRGATRDELVKMVRHLRGLLKRKNRAGKQLIQKCEDASGPPIYTITKEIGSFSNSTTTTAYDLTLYAPATVIKAYCRVDQDNAASNSTADVDKVGITTLFVQEKLWVGGEGPIYASDIAQSSPDNFYGMGVFLGGGQAHLRGTSFSSGLASGDTQKLYLILQVWRGKHTLAEVTALRGGRR